MTYKLSANLNMPEFPHAAVEQFFDTLDDLLREVRESLSKCPDMRLTIEVEKPGAVQ